MSASEKVQFLRSVISGLEAPRPRETYATHLLSSGIPKGSLVELIGNQKTEWLLAFLKEQSSGRIFWAERDQKILPTAIHQRGVNLERITFGLLGADPTPSLRRIVQSQLYSFIIAPQCFEEIRVFKAFQLLTEKSQSVLFLLGNKEPTPAWPITLQLEISQHDGEWRTQVLRQKGAWE